MITFGFSFVTERLAISGAINDQSDANKLIDSGITHVINCRDDFDEAPLYDGTPIKYRWNPTPDDGVSKPVSWFRDSLEFALPIFAVPGTKILCHCKDGINRGPSTAYAILRALGLSRFEAEALIRVHRMITNFGLRYHDCADNAIIQLGYGS